MAKRTMPSLPILYASYCAIIVICPSHESKFNTNDSEVNLAVDAWRNRGGYSCGLLRYDLWVII